MYTHITLFSKTCHIYIKYVSQNLVQWGCSYIKLWIYLQKVILIKTWSYSNILQSINHCRQILFSFQSWMSQQPMIESSSNFKLKLRGPYQIRNAWHSYDLHQKMTSNGRWPQNIEIWISQQSLIVGPNQNKNYLKWNWLPMEDGL